MKTFYALLVVLLVASSINAQAKKYPLFEHFTQASCPPCATQNPPFENNILTKNVGIIHHVSYHTSWPGTDPMYDYNKSQSAEMVSYYGISGVPTMIMLGTKYSGSPANVTQAMVDDASSVGSPIRLKVKMTPNGASQDVSVEVVSVGVPPAGNVVLKVAVVEKEIDYANPPGNNGEKNFPNVFRKMLTGTSGTPFLLAQQGSSVSSNYSFAMDAAWQADQIYVLAWVQNSSTKEVLNSGSSTDPRWEIGVVGNTFQRAGGSGGSAFESKLLNMGTTSGNFRVKFTATQPGDWAVTHTVNGNSVVDSVDMVLNANSSVDAITTVVSGNTAALGQYTVSLQSLDNASNNPHKITTYLISGVTDLVVDNDGGYAWEKNYEDGLTYANNNTHAICALTTYLLGVQANAFTGVKNIYWNAGWSFPYLTDELVGYLGSFLDNGGNLLIAGQDLGWDVWTMPTANPPGHGTTATQNFYTNYLNAQYLADGGTANNLLTANSSDAIFGAVPNSTMVNKHGSSSGVQNMYPDELKAIGNGQAAFYYNSKTTKVGCVHSLNSSTKSKVVYFGIGLEMISSDNVRNQIMKLTYDWFNSVVGVDEFTAKMRALSLEQNSPNPSSTFTTIGFSAPVTEAMDIVLYSIDGKLLETIPVASGTPSIRVNTTAYEAGVYLYQLKNNGKIIDSKKMTVVK